jgi:hypothetical protein
MWLGLPCICICIHSLGLAAALVAAHVVMSMEHSAGHCLYSSRVPPDGGGFKLPVDKEVSGLQTPGGPLHAASARMLPIRAGRRTEVLVSTSHHLATRPVLQQVPAAATAVAVIWRGGLLRLLTPRKGSKLITRRYRLLCSLVSRRAAVQGNNSCRQCRCSHQPKSGV